MTSPANLFNCTRCPAYCCSYPEIRVKKKDARRLADHLGLSLAQILKKFTTYDAKGKKRIMRHRSDVHFGTVCKLLDRDTRQCSVYEARPQICQDFPGTRRCGYYDFLIFERRLLEDPEHISSTWNEP